MSISNVFGPGQDSYIAINEEGIVIDQCSTEADVSVWMESHTQHRLLITSTAQAIRMLGQPLPDEGDVEVMLL